MIKRTYSKRQLEVSTGAEDTSSKRRRVEDELETTSSSPSRVAAIFSDENATDWTPPSSPNLPVLNTIIEKCQNVNSSADALVLPSLAAKKPLQADSARNGLSSPKNAVPKQNPMPKQKQKQKPKTTTKPRPKTKAKQLTQMRLELGQQIQKRCQTCGMEYRPSVAEDKKLHSKFHCQNVDGIPLNHSLGQNLRLLEDEEGLYREEIILPIARHGYSSVSVRKLVHAVLAVVETELGGVGIEEEKLWGEVQVPGKAGNEGTMCDRYRTFLFVRKDRILGVCLAERIFEAYSVLPPSSKDTSSNNTANASPTQASSITTSEHAQPAMMGISRIWVSKCARKQGIAKRLLRFAAKRFIYHFNIPKEQIAFSQPTESGTRLARKWFGKESGWLVYPG